MNDQLRFIQFKATNKNNRSYRISWCHCNVSRKAFTSYLPVKRKKIRTIIIVYPKQRMVLAAPIICNFEKKQCTAQMNRQTAVKPLVRKERHHQWQSWTHITKDELLGSSIYKMSTEIWGRWKIQTMLIQLPCTKKKLEYHVVMAVWTNAKEKHFMQDYNMAFIICAFNRKLVFKWKYNIFPEMG